MDIITGLAIGNKGGKAVNNLICNYAKSVYEERIQKLESAKKKLEGHIDNLDSYKNDIRTIFTGDEADKYTKQLEIEINSVRVAHKRVEEAIAIWKTALDDQEAARKEINDKLDLIKQAQKVIEDLK